MRLLEKRFGGLPSKLRDQIASADSATLNGWLDRFEEGGDLGSIFTDGRRSAKVLAFRSKPSRASPIPWQHRGPSSP